MRFRKIFADAVVFVAVFQSPAFTQTGFAQGPPATVLEIDGENTVLYVNDVTDYSRLASDPSRVTATAPKNFISFIGLSDIKAVNGKPVNGTYVGRATGIFLRPEPIPGQAIADTVRNSIVDHVFEILRFHHSI